MNNLYKLLFVISIIIIPVISFAYTSPGQPTGYLNDFANIIPNSDRQTIENKLIALNKNSGVQVSVVTINSLGDETVESYANKLFQEWGIGVKDKDNGLLILVAVNDHKTRIEVGYGLEGTVTDLQSGNIIRNVMTPAFKNNDFAGGINGTIDALSGIISGDETISNQYSNNNSEINNVLNNKPSLEFIFFFIIVGLHVLAYFLGKTKSWWLGGVIGLVVGIVVGLIWGFVFAGFLAMILLSIIGLIFDFIVSKHPPKSGGGVWPIFFGGRGGGGFGGGGFGGFGGGRSGGGGASGGW